VITLSRGPDGCLTTTLPDHRGRHVRYRLRPLPEGNGVEMRREDDGGLYVARKGRLGWVCNCKAFAFSKVQPPGCKHTRLAAELLAVLRPDGGAVGGAFVTVT
jgi:hypothetical protein